MDRQDVKFSIRKKILGVTLVAALPFLAISIYLLISMSNYNHTYNKIVQNLTIANNYNLDFKEEMERCSSTKLSSLHFLSDVRISL